jgi:hypothetical protein
MKSMILIIAITCGLLAQTPAADTTVTSHWEFNNLFFVGAGIGLEFLFFQHVALAIELPLSVQFSGNGFNMWPIPNGSLIYFF